MTRTLMVDVMGLSKDCCLGSRMWNEMANPACRVVNGYGNGQDLKTKLVEFSHVWPNLAKFRPSFCWL